MKTFEPGFFALENFIVKQETFDAREPQAGEPWHVAYNVNDPFFRIMGASMVSVLENNPDHPFVFHLFTDGYSRDNAEKIRQLAEKWHCRCTLYELDMEPFQDFHVKVARFSRITYGRLYMAKVLKKETDRFLYLDADTMVIRPLEELFALPLEGKGRVSETEEREVLQRRHYDHQYPGMGKTGNHRKSLFLPEGTPGTVPGPEPGCAEPDLRWNQPVPAPCLQRIRRGRG